MSSVVRVWARWALDRLLGRPRAWRCADCGAANLPHEWCCYVCGAGHPRDA